MRKSQLIFKKFDKIYDTFLQNFKFQCIRRKIIQLKVRRRALEIPAENEASVFNCE